ncbi:MAG TPA: GNAT family N-acetyltransferase [Tepidisphaeraceae bacterium]
MNSPDLPKQLRIRDATAADVPSMFTIRIAVKENATTREVLAAKGVNIKSVREMLETTTRGWIAEEAGNPVGFALADSNTRSIFALFVLPQAQHQGVGTRLLHQAINWLRSQSNDPIWLETGADTPARTFYQRQGWVSESITDGEIRMRLP